MKDLILNKISSYRDEILDFTKALIATRTENPPGRSYRSCVEVIARMLEDTGLKYEIVEVPRGPGTHPRYCLLSFHRDGEKALYFHGHYDVVPASNEEQFQPYVKEGRLFGRGSADMKGGLAAMIFAVKAVKECGLPLGGRIGLTIVPDEETGGELGSRYLAEAGLLGVNGVGMLTAEPTGGVIWNASRGAISLHVTVRGKPAHVGLSYQGINAFEGMVATANELAKLKSEVESRTTGFKITPDQARSSILLLGGKCEGGTNFNVVPDKCSFTVDRRINPEEDLEKEKQKLFAVFERLAGTGIDLSVEILQEGESAGVPESAPLAQALSESVKDLTGRRPAFEMCPGLLETRFYVRHGIPGLAYGPGTLSVSHGPEEHVTLGDLHTCAAAYALTSVRLLTV